MTPDLPLMNDFVTPEFHEFKLSQIENFDKLLSTYPGKKNKFVTPDLPLMNDFVTPDFRNSNCQIANFDELKIWDAHLKLSVKPVTPESQ